MSYGTIQIEKMTTESGYSLGAGNASSFKNRAINGGMVVDQRNAGASITTGSGANFIVDRFNLFASVASKFTGQQNQGGVTPPAGFPNYLGATCSSAYTPGASEAFLIYQGVEGFNVADLDYGKSTAKTATVSFWARSNLTGNFAFAFRNAALNRQYVTSYNIGAANTWQYITLTIPGDTTGAWNSTNGAGINMCWDLGSNSAYNATTLNTWGNQGSTNQAYTFSGATQVISGTNNYLYITGVQLEVGTVATSFDFRDYGTELLLCQRYYEQSNGVIWSSTGYYSTFIRCGQPFLVQKRTTPTVTFSSVFNSAGSSVSIISSNTTSTHLGWSADSVAQSFGISFSYTASAEL